MKITRLLLLMLLFTTLIQAEDIKLTVVYTSDLHGVLLSGKDSRSDNHPGSLARVATLVKKWRSEDPELILLDCGDTIQGNPLMYFAARQMSPETANPIISVMNVMKYDAMAIGNHEFNFGKDYLAKLAQEADFPFLSGNISNTATGEPAYQPYSIIEKKGLRIGILGLVTDGVPNWELPRHVENLKFISPVSAAESYVSYLKEKENCDIVIVVLHDGLVRDPDAYSEDDQSSGVRISQIEGIDLLLTGHIHRSIAPMEINQTFAATCPPYGRGVVRFELKITTTENKDRVVTATGELIEIDDSIENDLEVVDLAEPYYALTDAYLDTEIAENEALIKELPSRHLDSPLVDLLHKAQLSETGADISFASLLPWQGFTLKAGPVTIRDIFKFYPYENQLVTIQINGKQLREALEWSARYFDGVTINKAGLSLLIDGAISPYNMDHAEGVEYRIDPTAKEMNRIRDLTFKGRPVQDNQVFSVALNSYRHSGGGGFAMFKAAKLLKEADRGVREVLIDYIRQHGLADAKPTGNWIIAPDFVNVIKQGSME
jgi:2',3'-cyclic-nucleotide 2'-phosphodiesterase (5'-nucleotidase family)